MLSRQFKNSLRSQFFFQKPLKCRDLGENTNGILKSVRHVGHVYNNLEVIPEFILGIIIPEIVYLCS